ncbi:MAG: winged helix-turn-helix domain-containing protein [Candidatus Diapherotrites archaeon]
MGKEYLSFLPVSSDKVADILKTEAVWQIMKAIRHSRHEGMTVNALSEKLHESPSTVYNAIKQLERAGFVYGVKKGVHMKKRGRPSREISGEYRKSGKSPKIYFEPCEYYSGYSTRKEGEIENPWGDIKFSHEFNEEIGQLIKKNPKYLKNIFSVLGGFLDSFYGGKLKNSKDTGVVNLLPDKELCSRCNNSHEGNEFMRAIVLIAVTQYLDSDSFAKILKKYELRG